MKYLISSVFTISLLIFIFGCEKPEEGIVVENNSDYDIYCVISTIYPDTTIRFIDKETMMHEPLFFVKSRTTKSISNLTYCEKYTFDTYFQSGTMILFVFDKITIDNTAWDLIEKKQLVYRKYYLKYSDLQNRKCRITVE
jgi:hypothetical protein